MGDMPTALRKAVGMALRRARIIFQFQERIARAHPPGHTAKMLTLEQALVRARRHSNEINPQPNGIVLDMDESGRRFKDGWYFDYVLTASPNEGFGGPPGFVVADDGRVKAITWQEYTNIVRS